MRALRTVTRTLAAATLRPDERARLAALPFSDAGHGYDAFGLHRDALSAAVGLSRFAYERYFRVEGHGRDHVPRHGAAILVANHSGMLPLDAAMIVIDLLRSLDPPRLARAVGDRFIPLLPTIGTLLSRVGMVSGSRGNFEYLLERGELVLVFPEGTPGVGKTFDHRYELMPFRVGHAELALRYRVPVVPIAVIGAEEAWPALTRIDGVHPFGVPWLPIPLTPVPLPVKFRIHYGAPLELSDLYGPTAADDPDALDEAASRVQQAVQRLMRAGLRARSGVFT